MYSNRTSTETPYTKSSTQYMHNLHNSIVLSMTMPSTNNFRAASSLGSSIIRTRLHSQILFIQILAQETTILLHALLQQLYQSRFSFSFSSITCFFILSICISLYCLLPSSSTLDLSSYNSANDVRKKVSLKIENTQKHSLLTIKKKWKCIKLLYAS